MTMPEHNQYQLQQQLLLQQNDSKSNEKLRIFLPTPPLPVPSSSNKFFAKKMTKLGLYKPFCSRATLAPDEDLPKATQISESSNEAMRLDSTGFLKTSTPSFSPPLLLLSSEDDYFEKPHPKLTEPRDTGISSSSSPCTVTSPSPALGTLSTLFHYANTLNLQTSATRQSQLNQRRQQHHSVPMQISINNKLKTAVFNHQQCSKRSHLYKISSNKLLSTVCRTSTSLVLLFLAVSALLNSSPVHGMPQTSVVASSYHHLKGAQSPRYHHHSHQSTPSSSSPYSSSSSSSSSAVRPQQPQQEGNTYQAHGYHNKYHPFSSSHSPSSSSVQHQPPVKSSPLKQDSNNYNNHNHRNHDHHQSAELSALPASQSSVIDSEGNALVNASCPTCGRRFDLQQAKSLKLEAIQQQILSKLNLMEKPKVNQNWLKREQALEAIRKAKLNSKVRGRSRSAAISSTGSSSMATNRKRHSRRESDTPVHHRLNFSPRNSSSLMDSEDTTAASTHNFGSLFGQDEIDDEEEEEEEEMESSADEYYGKTSEIIAFAEPGRTINGHTLVDLTPPHDNLHKLAVTKAILWARLIYNRTAVRAQFPKRKPVFSAPVTLYIFKVVNKSHTGGQQQQTESGSWASNSVIYPTPFFQRSSEMHQRRTGSSNGRSSSTSYQQQQQWKNSGADQNESNRLQFTLLTTHRLPKPSRGWTQIDLTAAVADWYAQASSSSFSSDKLTLLIDCVGCNQLLEIDLATGNRPNTSGGSSQRKNKNNRLQKGSRTSKKQSTFSQTTSNNASSTSAVASAYGQTIKSRNYNVSGKTNNNLTTTVSQESHRKVSGTRKPRRHFQPFVVITTRTKLKRRNRRHAYNCEDGKIKQCCKQSLFVDFSLLGWDDWIIYPKGYTANYCMGECVQLHRTPDVMAYFHSHVIEEYRMKNPYASITPCCAPTKLSSISLIYFDPEGHIIKSDLPKMVVDECGCT